MLTMGKRTHGGDWAAYLTEYGREPLDFSANISPLGVPEEVRRAIGEAAARADRYPDPDSRALRAAIAAREGVSAEQVLCGSGAAELIWRAVRAAHPGRALVTAPCFGEYEAALEAVGCGIVRHPLDGNFRLNAEFLEEIDNNIEIVILCQPNNPSGVSIEPALLRRIAARCAETRTRLVLDECFVGFLDEPERYSLVPELAMNPRLTILKAFTKLCGMAGVRLGCALSADAAFLDAMRREGPPWSVSSLAQAAGLAALRETAYTERVRALVRRERPWLREQLCALGLTVVPGEANFLLFRSETPLDAPLRERGILLRGCADFAGLDGAWHRAAVRTHEENERLIAALREVLG